MRAVYVDGLRNVLDRLAASPEPPGLRQLDERLRQATTATGSTRTRRPNRAPRPAGSAWTPRRVADGLGPRRDRQVVVLRFSGLYGPGRIVRRAMIESGEPIPGDPDKYLNLVHIDDAAQAVVAALDAADAVELCTWSATTAR